MAVANTFTFGGVSTSAYGLTLEGSGDYSAPKRAVETIEIPGRNGAFQLDKGYFENIEVEYAVVVKDATQANFRDLIDTFRNALVAQAGYQRLEDTYHPNEFRLAMYAGGLDEDPAWHGNGAIFKVKFNCKPQRFLTSGEDEIIVDDGDTLTNPTPYEARPLLSVVGYGAISFNGYDIVLNNETAGYMILFSGYFSESVRLRTDLVGASDYINVHNANMSFRFNTARTQAIESVTVSGVSPSAFQGSASFIADGATGEVYISNALQALRKSDIFQDQFTVTIAYSGGITDTLTCYFTFGFDTDTRTFIATASPASGSQLANYEIVPLPSYTEKMDVTSTETVLGHPTYIDCEIGEAYKVVDDEVISLNRYIELGSKLPTLAPGANEFSVAGTISQLDVFPRWWKL